MTLWNGWSHISGGEPRRFVLATKILIQWSTYTEVWSSILKDRLLECCSSRRLQLNSDKTEPIWFAHARCSWNSRALRRVSVSVAWRSDRSNQSETLVSHWVASWICGLLYHQDYVGLLLSSRQESLTSTLSRQGRSTRLVTALVVSIMVVSVTAGRGTLYILTIYKLYNDSKKKENKDAQYCTLWSIAQVGDRVTYSLD